MFGGGMTRSDQRLEPNRVASAAASMSPASATARSSIKGHRHTVWSDRPFIMHDEGDFLRGSRLPVTVMKGLFRRPFFATYPDRTTRPAGGSRLRPSHRAAEQATLPSNGVAMASRGHHPQNPGCSHGRSARIPFTRLM
jgi:hypothetical protein